ncbi:MAG: hypothetical protein HOP02_03790 [Methylococcaceae bacterium]|nr:hypothetical protein [Methylococcaceae bacterium]
MRLFDSQHKGVADLAEQLMAIDTKEGLIKTILHLYRFVGEHFQEEELINAYYPAKIDAQAHTLDKLIELSYIIHRDKWRKGSLDDFRQNWMAQPISKDDMDFERYLKNLKS